MRSSVAKVNGEMARHSHSPKRRLNYWTRARIAVAAGVVAALIAAGMLLF